VKANLEFAREGKFLSESNTLLSLTLIISATVRE
jgi:hypothetical protein